jgi:hypothetical protein
MRSFKMFVESRDAEQLRRMGINPKGMTVSKFPQHDYDYINQSHDAAHGPPSAYQAAAAEEDEFGSDEGGQYAATAHTDADQFGDPGEGHYNDERVKGILQGMKYEVRGKMLLKLHAAAKKHKDFSMHQSLLAKVDNGEQLDATDWLVAADWLEDKGEPAQYMRRFARKMHQ